MKNALLSMLMIFTAFVFISCSDDNNPTNTEPQVDKGQMKATVAGSSWTSLTTMAVHKDGVLTVTGMKNYNFVGTEQLVITMQNPKVGDNVAVGGYVLIPNIQEPNNFSTWQSLSATVKITSLTATEVKGTFSFTGTNLQDNTTKTVTNGAFYVGLN